MNTSITIFLLFCVLLFPVLNDNALSQNKKFYNPILAGFYPDPSICKVGSDYYLVNSTFSYFPGISVFHSKDLVNWSLIGYVLDRREQMDLDGQGVSRGIFAPAIRYNKGVYYVTCTLVDIGGNFVATSKNPAGPWSNPVWLPQINGIDPSLFFDENGKSYIIYNSIAPDDKPQYQGHRTIRMYEFDAQNLKVTGDEHLLINGGTDIRKKPIWIEAPHIFQKDGYYYLIAAEGGTRDQHSEVVFRSTKVDGPYISYENNPILTQRNLNPKREFAITSTGHADFVQTDAGEWWAVFLGCRPYRPFDEDYYNTGRETFLAPVKWKNGWPIINPDNEQVQYYYPYPVQAAGDASRRKKENADIPYGGNFQFRDDFNTEVLDRNWVFLRTPRDKWYDLSRRKGFLVLQLREESCDGNANPSFLGRRQSHARGSASISIGFMPAAENEKAGLLVFQNESHFYFLSKSLEGGRPAIQLYRSLEKGKNQMELIASQRINDDQNKKQLLLKIEARENLYSFYYAYDHDIWNLLKDSVDGKFLSTKVAEGFVGCLYALYATSLGSPSTTAAYFDWFEYRGDDEAYK